MSEQNRPKAEVDPTEQAGKATPTESKDKVTGEKPKEYGGPKGPEPTRYGDWQTKGIVSDF